MGRSAHLVPHGEAEHPAGRCEAGGECEGDGRSPPTPPKKRRAVLFNAEEAAAFSLTTSAVAHVHEGMLVA